MANQKLTSEQRESLLEWLAADYDWKLIKEWFEKNSWPLVSRSTISHYRKSNAIRIDELRAARLDSSLNTGLSRKEERIERLKKHADALESIKWEPDKNGRMWNEKAWRETLADIAAEMGHRKQTVDINAKISWQDRAKEQGIDPDEIKARAKIAAAEILRNRGAVSGSDSGGSDSADGASE